MTTQAQEFETAVAQGNALPGELVVLARTPQEMEVAQKQLTHWADGRITMLRKDLAEAEENLAHARKHKWKVTPWQKTVALARGRVEFYEKVQAALEAGYCIMPDVPAQLIAIRTTRRNPRHELAQSQWRHPQLDDQETTSPPLGEGKNVNPQPSGQRFDNTVMEGQNRDRKVTYHMVRTSSWQDVDFPIRLVKPQILDDTGKALALKIFDELGILPGENMTRGSAGPAKRRQPDPIVLGRIVRREGRQRIALSFLISWWIDTSTL